MARAARSAMFPIKFDERLNEYSFEDEARHASLMIYHCPMCGGVASASRRSVLFRRVGIKEFVRLDKLTNQLRTIADIEGALGNPDEIVTHKKMPAEVKMLKKMVTSPVRQWIFKRLSSTADVLFSIYPRGEIERVVMPKPKRRPRTE
jgi:hypothetical protein